MSMKKITKAMIFMIVMVASLALNGKLVQAAGDFDYVDSNEDAESIVPHKVTVGDEDDLSKSSNYIIHVPGVTREITIPVIIDHKGILIFKHGDENESTSGYTLKFYSDIACTNEISSYGGKVKFKEAGTYYLKVTLPSYTTITEESFKVIFQCKLLDGRGKSLKNKQWLFTAVLDTGAPVYSRNISLQTWTSKTIPKGTYYIRLYKDSKTTSGNYSVKVKVRK